MSAAGNVGLVLVAVAGVVVAVVVAVVVVVVDDVGEVDEGKEFGRNKSWLVKEEWSLGDGCSHWVRPVLGSW